MTIRRIFTVLSLTGLVFLLAGCATANDGSAERPAPHFNSVHSPSSGLDRARLWFGDDSLGR